MVEIHQSKRGLFRHITFESRADLGEAEKVSYSGQRIAEIYRYCSFTFSRPREVTVLTIGTNDLLKRFSYTPGPLTAEDCFEPLVPFIEWVLSLYKPRVIVVCTLFPIPKDEQGRRCVQRKYLCLRQVSRARENQGGDIKAGLDRDQLC